MSDDRADTKEAAIEIPLNKVAVASFVMFSVLMTAAGIWMIIVASSLVFWAIGVIGGVFFGCFTVLAVARLWDSLPGLTLDSLGIIDRSSLVYAGRVPWDEVLAVRPSRMYGQKMFVFVLRDHKAFCARFSGIARLAFTVSPWITGGSFAVSSQMLQIDSASLAELLLTDSPGP